MKKDLIIIGAGSVGGYVASSLNNGANEFNLIGFLDDNKAKTGKSFVGVPVLGSIDSIVHYPLSMAIVICITNATEKIKIVEKLKKWGYNYFPSLIAESSWVSKLTSIGEGCIVYPGARINYNCSIGNFVVINMNCAIGHDCVIEDYGSFAPGVLLGGNTIVGRLTQMGIGAQTLQHINIGNNCTIGAGSVIIRNVQDTAVVVGNPGSIIKYNS